MTDRVKENYISEGRDPDWRLAWEENLSSEARTEIGQSLKERRRVANPDLLDYAQGLARRRLRSFRWSLAMVPLHMGLVTLWIYATCFIADPPQAWCWFYIGVGLLWLLLAPFLIRRRRSHLEAALKANENPAD